MIKYLFKIGQAILKVRHHGLWSFLEHLSKGVSNVSVNVGFLKTDQVGQWFEELLGVGSDVTRDEFETLRKAPWHLYIIIDVFSFF